MEREDAIRASQAAMDALARISEEIQEIDWLIVRYGQARWYNPEKVKRLSRTRDRLLAERADLIALKNHAAQYI